MWIVVCTGCRQKVGAPRPGSIKGVKEIESECPFCRAKIDSSKGYEMTETAEAPEEFDLLSVD